MKTFDIVAAILLVVGGLNWGLVGAAQFDLVAAIFGRGSAFANVIYILVGLSALYQAISVRAIQRRWHVATA